VAYLRLIYGGTTGKKAVYHKEFGGPGGASGDLSPLPQAKNYFLPAV